MKTFKIFFTSWHFANSQTFLNTIIHLTPNASGKWGNIEATTNPKEADYFVIFDGPKEHLTQEQQLRALYFCQHPLIDSSVYSTHENYSKSFKTYDNIKCLGKYNSKTGLNPAEIWIKRSYDELKALPKPQKTKKLCFIVTYQNHNLMYTQRIKFAEALVQSGVEFDLYGRPEALFRANPILNRVYKGSLGSNSPDGSLGLHTIGKDQILEQYEYTIELDVGPVVGSYISERFWDSILYWCKPFYFGSFDVHKYVPQESFQYINILDIPNSVETIKKHLTRSVNYDSIQEARLLCLDKYSVWPTVHDIINNFK